MRRELIEELNKRKQELEDELEQVNNYLATLDAYKNVSVRVEPEPSKLTSRPTLLKPKARRVRGVLAAAKRAIQELPGPFDKYMLLDQLKRDDEFIGKTISSTNIRNTLRLLTQIGVIKIESEATATSCAKYVRAA